MNFRRYLVVLALFGFIAGCAIKPKGNAHGYGRSVACDKKKNPKCK